MHEGTREKEREGRYIGNEEKYTRKRETREKRREGNERKIKGRGKEGERLIQQ